MARLSSGKNEPQDPSLPQKQRARWRFIGATVLALGAMIVLPLALDSEPRRPLGDVQITIPDRAELGRRNQAWPDVAYRTTLSEPGAEAGRPGLFTRDGDDGDAAGGTRAVVPVDANVANSAAAAAAAAVAASPGSSAAPVAAPEKGAPAQVDPAREIRSTHGAAATGTAVKESSAHGQAKPARDATTAKDPGPPTQAKPARDTTAAKEARPPAKAGSASGDAKPADRAKPAKPATSPTQIAAVEQKVTKPAVPTVPPVPQRRTDRNQEAASSPGGYVVQIGAFKSRKGATAQLERARKLGFDAYAEPFTTRKGEYVRVRVGPYLTREQADQARERLSRNGIDTSVISP